MEPSREGRSSDAVRVWMPLAAAAAAISFVISFVIGVPPQQAITATALAAILVFSGLLFSSFGRNKGKYQNSKWEWEDKK
ncbi:MAG TPA: hypothetical protein VH415_03540 [Nitrososphaeraceae archaeon]